MPKRQIVGPTNNTERRYILNRWLNTVYMRFVSIERFSMMINKARGTTFTYVHNTENVISMSKFAMLPCM
jgi:hypothetical protein